MNVPSLRALPTGLPPPMVQAEVATKVKEALISAMSLPSLPLTLPVPSRTTPAPLTSLTFSALIVPVTVVLPAKVPVAWMSISPLVLTVVAPEEVILSVSRVPPLSVPPTKRVEPPLTVVVLETSTLPA